MNPKFIFLLATLIVLLAARAVAESSWPQFRGPNAQGVAEQAHPPVRFGPQTNLLWKTAALPGLSSPVISGNHLFLTAKTSNQLVTLAYDARTGRELWRHAAAAQNIERCHDFSSPAASTPCTDGQRLFVYFGSYGVLAYDFAGAELWRRPFPAPPTQYGTASSPIVSGSRLILQRDGNSTNSQVIALDAATGRTLWEAARPLSGESYSTPMVWRHEGLEELVVLGKGRLAAYKLADGQPGWWVSGWGFSALTTPIAGDGLLFAGGSGTGDPTEPPDPELAWDALISKYDANRDGQLALDEVPASLGFHIRKDVSKETPGNYFPFRDLAGWFVDKNKDKILTKAEWDAFDGFMKDKQNADKFVAVRPNGDGNISASHVAWETTRGLPELASALLYQSRLYLIRDGGMLTVIEPKTGRRILDRERLGAGGQYVASPVAANGNIYLVNETGTFTVIRTGDRLEVMAVNTLAAC